MMISPPIALKVVLAAACPRAAIVLGSMSALIWALIALQGTVTIHDLSFRSVPIPHALASFPAA